MQNSKILPIVHVLSKLGVLYALILMIPTLFSYFYMDGTFGVFAKTAFATLVGSGLAWLATLNFQRELRPRDGFTLVVMLWVGFAAISAIPFYLYLPGMNYNEAFFESISGLTTTGATVISSLDTLAPSLNFWRHMLNWLGGMGIIVLAVAILPMLGVGGTQLFKAEIPGIEKDSKMAPRISQVAKRLWLSYTVITVIAFFALRAAGMSWFDALCHALSSASLGGFSTHDSSIAYFDSYLVEIVVCIVTVLGAVNFSNHFALFQTRSFKTYWKQEESRVMLVMLTASILVVSLFLWHKQHYAAFGEALRFTGFNFISIGLASGFSSEDFAKWPLMASLWMFFLANILANTGSMGGGVKMARVLVLAKFSLREMMLLLHPNAVRTVKVDKRAISDRTAMAVMAFIFVYFMTIIVFTFAQMIAGMDFMTAFTATLACITNTGPGLGGVGPSHNYGELTDLQKWLCTVVMLLGRLEIFTVFILFTPGYWKK